MEYKVEKRPTRKAEELAKFYKSAPGNLAFFAGSPYILSYASGVSLVHAAPFTKTHTPRTRMMLAGISQCTILTVIPALPAATALTIGLSVIGGLLTALSAPVAYPIAMAVDHQNKVANMPRRRA